MSRKVVLGLVILAALVFFVVAAQTFFNAPLSIEQLQMTMTAAN